MPQFDRLAHALQLIADYQEHPIPREVWLSQHEEYRDLLEPMLDELDDGAQADGAAADRPVTITDDYRDDSTPSTKYDGWTIGPYRILDTLGEGGMGTVYMAEQREPIHRRVALKVIRLGMNTVEVLARFEAERQALAVMDHPTIAKVYDAGATTDGRPYFAMEYIQGDTLNKFCDRHKLTTEERLRIFIEICQGVQHAHQKGVIHRDLKPSNILVTMQDEVPVPRIIDFGVAKATALRLTEKTLFTEAGQIIGTPEYMSPEQAGTTALDIDTRSDVYSLGVILYELLIGALPFDSKTLRSAGYAEIQRIISEVEPPRPSTKLGNLGGDSTVSATNRRADARTLIRSVRGDLDWITMKALEKDRRRRYDSPLQLADDIQRHLDDEPVLAGPPSQLYRLKKFVRKRRGLVAATAIVLVSLVGGFIGTYLQYVEADDARTKAETNLAKAREEKERADREAKAANTAREAEAKRAAELKVVAEFQAERLKSIDVSWMAARLREDLVDRVRAASESAQYGEEATEERLTQLERALAGADFTGLALTTLEENVFVPAVHAIQAEFADQPLVRAMLFQSLTEQMRGAGLFEHARETQEGALETRVAELGREHPDTLESLFRMGLLKSQEGDYAASAADLKEVTETRRRVLGAEHPDTMLALFNLGFAYALQDKNAEALACYEEALTAQRRVLGDDHHNTLLTIMNMGSLLQHQGKFDDAERLLEEAVDSCRRVLGREHEDTLTALRKLGELRKTQGRPDEAETCFREVVEGSRKAVGDRHPLTLIAIHAFAQLLFLHGKGVEAEQHFDQLVETSSEVLGYDHPNTLTYRVDRAALRRATNKVEQAASDLSEALEAAQRVFGKDHPNTLTTMRTLAGVLASQGKHDPAERYYRDSLDASRRVLGDKHPDTIITLNNLGVFLETQGKLPEAKRYYAEALEAARETFGNEHPETIGHLNTMAIISRQLGKFDEAAKYYRENVEVLRKVGGIEDTRLLISLCFLSTVLIEAEELGEAEAVAREAAEGAKQTRGEKHMHFAFCVSQHGEALQALERYSEAAVAFETAHSVMSEVLGEKHPNTLSQATFLAKCYESWDTAEPDAGHDKKAKEWRGRAEPQEEAKEE